jgi:Tfp pilus assembly protein PilF
MNSSKLVVAMAGCLVLLGGCATGPASETTNPVAAPASETTNPVAAPSQGGKGQQALAAGVKQFEEGVYADATKSLQSSLDLGLAGAADKMKAHKYLAFIHCVSGRQKQCQDEFRKALVINPAMELDPSESGHPIWGPEFRNAKARK